MRQAGEPSVEEILSSIKKVIARDSRIYSAKRDDLRTNGRAGRGGDVLDLSEVAAQVLAAPPGKLRAQAGLHDHDTGYDHDAGHDHDTGCDHDIGVDHGTGVDHGAGVDEDDEGSLLSKETTSAMRDSLAALAMLSQPGARPQIVRSGETSLEGMVREMLRPMLAKWLDQHLPTMVEQMVAAEIARIVQKKT